MRAMGSATIFQTLVGLVLAAAGGVPLSMTAHATRPDLRELSQANTERGALSTSRAQHYDGSRAYDARFCGGPGNGYARGTMPVRWIPGSTWSYGVALLLPKALQRHQQGEIDLMRWDNYPLYGQQSDYGGIVVYESDHRARLERGRYDGGSDVLGDPITLPRGRWFWLEVRQRLSAGPDAMSIVKIDGRTVLLSRQPNSFGREIRRVRFGLVAIDEQRQERTLRLFFDRATVRPWTIGPVPAGRRSAVTSGRAQTRFPRRVPATCAG